MDTKIHGCMSHLCKMVYYVLQLILSFILPCPICFITCFDLTCEDFVFTELH